MIEIIKYLWKEANAKINGEKTNTPWYIGNGTSGNKYIWTKQDNATCYIYISKNDKYSRPTFSLITEKYPYGTEEIGYQEALRLAKESV